MRICSVIAVLAIGCGGAVAPDFPEADTGPRMCRDAGASHDAAGDEPPEVHTHYPDMTPGASEGGTKPAQFCVWYDAPPEQQCSARCCGTCDNGYPVVCCL